MGHLHTGWFRDEFITHSNMAYVKHDVIWDREH